MLECRDGRAGEGDGELRALLSFVPWGPHGLSLDLMRRDRDSENGLMEFMVLELLRRASEIGVTQVSLNFAMFRSVFERGARLGAGPVLRLWRSLLSFFSRWWQIESLYRANAKYRPIWEPRFLLFEKSADLLRIGVASARAEDSWRLRDCRSGSTASTCSRTDEERRTDEDHGMSTLARLAHAEWGLPYAIMRRALAGAPGVRSR